MVKSQKLKSPNAFCQIWGIDAHFLCREALSEIQDDGRKLLYSWLRYLLYLASVVGKRHSCMENLRYF
jgi:hypothetical protein